MTCIMRRKWFTKTGQTITVTGQTHGRQYCRLLELYYLPSSLPRLERTHTTRMHTHTHARTHAHTHARMRTQTRTHARTHKRTHARTQTLTHKHACTYTCMHTRTHTHTHARTHARMHAHTHTHTQSITTSFTRYKGRQTRSFHSMIMHDVCHGLVQMAKQNKELKRQSQMLLQQRGLDITEINLDQLDPADTKDDELQKEYIKTLNDKIQSEN